MINTLYGKTGTTRQISAMTDWKNTIKTREHIIQRENEISARKQYIQQKYPAVVFNHCDIHKYGVDSWIDIESSLIKRDVEERNKQPTPKRKYT